MDYRTIGKITNAVGSVLRDILVVAIGTCLGVTLVILCLASL
jgi:hypothetical protein